LEKRRYKMPRREVAEKERKSRREFSGSFRDVKHYKRFIITAM